MKNSDKIRNVGYEIHEINKIKNGNQFEVIVRYPDLEGTTQRFVFTNNENWNSKREYVTPEGEVREDYNWKIHIIKNLRKNHEEEVSSSDLDFDPEEEKGGKINP